PRGPIFFTVAPVRAGERINGAVFVAIDLPRLLKQVARSSLSDGVIFYTEAGAMLSYSTAGSDSTSIAPSALPTGWYERITGNPDAPVRFRTLDLPADTYAEALGEVPGRGLEGQPPGVYGVLLSSRTLDGKLQETLWSLLPLFVLGLALIVFIGRVLA